VSYEDTVFEMAIFDTMVREDGDRLARLSCPQTDLFIMCFTPTSIHSLESVTKLNGFHTNIVESYYATMGADDPYRAPYVLVETGSDRRDDPELQKRLEERGTAFVTQQQVRYLTASPIVYLNDGVSSQIDNAAKELGAIHFQRTSAKLDTGITELFEEIIPRLYREHVLPKKGKLTSKRRTGCDVS